MEKSGQRAPNPEIINEPGLRSKKRVFWETMVTLGLWGGFLYLLEFIFLFTLWVFGFNLIQLEIYKFGKQEIMRLFRTAGLITTIVLLATLSWSYYNMLLIKIRGERRCNRVRICFDHDLADFFKIDPEMLEKAKNYPRVSVVMEEDTIIIIGDDFLPGA